MEFKEPITVEQYLQLKKIRANKKRKMSIGWHSAITYKAVFGELPEKIQVGDQKHNIYPPDRVIVIDYIADKQSVPEFAVKLIEKRLEQTKEQK